MYCNYRYGVSATTYQSIGIFTYHLLMELPIISALQEPLCKLPKTRAWRTTSPPPELADRWMSTIAFLLRAPCAAWSHERGMARACEPPEGAHAARYASAFTRPVVCASAQLTAASHGVEEGRSWDSVRRSHISRQKR